VSGQAVQGPEERVTQIVTRVRLADGPLLSPVLRRVMSMVLARADWAVERLDDALLLCETLSAHGPAHARDGRLTFSLRADKDEAELRVLDLCEHGATELLQDAVLPMVGNVIERIADRVSVEPDEQGAASQLVLVISSSK
jgi:hypothetical protein